MSQEVKGPRLSSSPLRLHLRPSPVRAPHACGGDALSASFDRHRLNAVTVTARSIAATLLLVAVVAVALLVVRASDAPGAACLGVVCAGQEPADHHAFPGHDACLPDNACGGGAALGLHTAIIAIAVIASSLHVTAPTGVLRPPTHERVPSSSFASRLERPPRV